MIFGGWRPHDLCQDRLQGFCPNVVAFRFEMQAVGRHAFEQLAFCVRQFVVDVQKANSLSVSQLGKLRVDLLDRFLEGHVLRGGKTPVSTIAASGACCWKTPMIALMPATTSSTLALSADPVAGQVVGAGLQHDHLRRDTIELAVLQAPEDVLSRIAAPAKVGRIPAVKVPFPVREEDWDSPSRPIAA